MSLIQLKNVDIAYDNFWIFKNLSLEIQNGECFVIMGPSGQGKTTLLKSLCGLISPRNGKVFIEQLELSTLSSKERLKILKKVGILFQKNALFDSLTCYENVAFPLREMGKISATERHQKVVDYLDAVGILQAKDLYPDEISGGMQKRLGIARALALDPEIVFYDDPTAGLDPITSRRIGDLILSLRKKNNSTLIAVTNDMNRAYQMADRIGFVFDGELVITGSAKETQQSLDARVQQFIQGKITGPLSSIT